MIYTVLIPNAIAMLLLLVLLFSAKSASRHILLFDSKIFFVMVICVFIQCTGEIIAYAIDGIMQPGFHVLNLAVNEVLFIVNILFAFLWVIYADYKIYEDIEHVKEFGKRMILPALVIILGSLINIFVPVFFEITLDNHYQRTFLFFIPYLVTYFYLAYGTIFIYRHKSQAKKYVFLPAIIFMIPIVLGSGIQFFFYGFSTIWIGVAIALVAVYMNVQNEICYIDMLSGLYTRIYMYQYLETELQKKDKQKKIAGIMLDIDEFKKINDTSGHLTGDDAIRSTGIILHNTLTHNGIAARYGGDEFVVLQEIDTEEDIIRTLEQINKAETDFNHSNKRKYTLHFSKGYSILDPMTDTVDTFLERMDSAMYKEKKKQKLQQNLITNPNQGLLYIINDHSQQCGDGCIL